MIDLLFFFVSFLASTIGGICGVGGGIIIKPVLDATQAMTVSGVSFLSGCTVLSMALVSFLRNRSTGGLLSFRTSTPLAVGAVFGGFAGKGLFDYAKAQFTQESSLGALQAGLLFVVLLIPLVHTCCGSRMRTFHIESLVLCGVVGILLGGLSAFLGIGGGPINLTVLAILFSMDVKKAAANSLYIILFSQLASLVQVFATQSIPPVGFVPLAATIIGGIGGGLLGNGIYRKISTKTVQRLFLGFIVLVLIINTYNLLRFTQFIV